MSEVIETNRQSAEVSSPAQHEVCGWTGTSATMAYAEVASTAQSQYQAARGAPSSNGNASLAAFEQDLSQLSQVPQGTIWKPIVIFFVVLFGSSVALAWPLAEHSSAWLRALLIPAFPVLCATALFWRRQSWKFRAKDWKFKLKVGQEVLDSVGYEAINAVNAIRANLIGFRLANPNVSMAEHLDEIENGAHRIDRVIQKSQDPVAWWVKKKKKKAPGGEEPSKVGEDARSRIAL